MRMKKGSFASGVYGRSKETMARTRKMVINTIDQNGDGQIGIDDIIIAALKAPGVRVSRAAFLQKELFIVVSGEARKTSLSGAPYGWPVTTYCTASRFFGDALEEAAGLDPSVARIEVIDRIRELNPAATDGAIARFLG